MEGIIQGYPIQTNRRLAHFQTNSIKSQTVCAQIRSNGYMLRWTEMLQRNWTSEQRDVASIPPNNPPLLSCLWWGVSLHSYLPAHRSGMIPVHPRAADGPPALSSHSQTNETQLVSKRRLPELSHVDTDHDTRAPGIEGEAQDLCLSNSEVPWCQLYRSTQPEHCRTIGAQPKDLRRLSKSK
ncbi:hypothetical protein F2P79_015324 [Pimephales promelas]|nr:hypothetical protein F2P79_015324 [Pimephales promelas]